MTDKAERRKFLKTALAALATAGVSGGCITTMCYVSAEPSRPEPDSENDNPTPPNGKENE